MAAEYRPDQDLIDDLLLLDKDVREQHHLEPQEAEYITACRLASGPNPQRAGYWKFKAKEMERELRRLWQRLY